METGDKNRYVAEARNVLRRKLRFRAFPERVCPQIWSLESVDYFKEREHFGGRKKKQNKTKQKKQKQKKKKNQNLRLRSFEMIQIRISDPRSLGSW